MSRVRSRSPCSSMVVSLLGIFAEFGSRRKNLQVKFKGLKIESSEMKVNEKILLFLESYSD